MKNPPRKPVVYWIHSSWIFHDFPQAFWPQSHGHGMAMAMAVLCLSCNSQRRLASSSTTFGLNGEMGSFCLAFVTTCLLKLSDFGGTKSYIISVEFIWNMTVILELADRSLGPSRKFGNLEPS
jgi:hypothetical protein